MTKARIKKPTIMKSFTENKELEVSSEPTVEPIPSPIVPKNPFANATKMVRQPNVDLAVDPILAQIIRDYETENEALQKQFNENTRARNKAMSKVLAMNGLQLRVNCSPKWVPGTDILSVPVPDVVAPVGIE